MSNFPESADVFVDRTAADAIASSDPNAAYDSIEATQGLVGALGKPQSWSTTLMTLIRKYSSGMAVDVSAGAPVVRVGEAVLENSDGTKFVFRRNTGDVALAAGNLDVGTLAATYYAIYLKGDSAASTAPLCYSTDFNSPSAIGTAPYRKIGWFRNESVGALAVTYAGGSEPGRVVNIISFATGAMVTGTGVIPLDDTIPQNTEGVQYMRLVYVPSKATNKLKVEAIVVCAHNAGGTIVAGIFKDSSADAIAVGASTVGANTMITIPVSCEFYPGSTAPIIFTVRAGGPAGTLTFNGYAGAQYYGGVMTSHITVTEIDS